MAFSEEVSAIEERLAAAGKTVGQLCDRAGVARSTWQRWKSGRTAPRMTTWMDVTAACDALAGPRLQEDAA